jgi:hypothetical protein
MREAPRRRPAKPRPTQPAVAATPVYPLVNDMAALVEHRACRFEN